jgi:type VI secretion system protein ImpL
MKQILITIFKGLLVLTVLALVVLLVFGLVMMAGWTWWAGFFLLLGIAGLYLGIMVFRKYMKRRQEQMFVHQIIAQDESMRQSMSPKDQSSAKELQARWKEAIDALRKSHLRKYGNPLYVLPWYMVIGESGSGKTTAIESARLSSPFADVSRTSGISGTRNCDWWFFEQAILIDTAGRYAIPVDEGRDKDEWQRFLNLLAKFRKKEPLNGLVVTVAADRLAQGGTEALQEDGRNIRRRMDELMRVLGAKFPVYVMVTKCDLVQGASQFCDALPEAALNQAMGLLNQQLSTDVPSFMNKAFKTIGSQLRDMRLLLLNQIQDREKATDMLLFPEELEKLKEPLTAFIAGAFQENPYQETPLLRGLFFSSGRQEGTPFSHFLNNLGLIQRREVLAGTNKGLFLHDVFARILPSDRQLFKPTQHMAQWSRLTRNMGLTAWIAVMVAVCGLLSYAFVKNLSALADVRREFEKPAVLQGDLLADVITMDRYRQALVTVETQNRNWWIPRLGLKKSLSVETALKEKYVGLFQNGFLKGFDKKMGDRMTTFSSRTPTPVFGAHVGLLVRRINLLKKRLELDEIETLSEFPQPAYGGAVLNRAEVIPEIQNKIGMQYLYAIAWQTDSDVIRKEITYLQTWLKHLLTLPGMPLNWLTDWVSSGPDAAWVTLETFWGGQASDTSNAAVPAAFTAKGQHQINAAILEIEAALFDPLIIAESKVAFEKWYAKAYVRSWQDFIAAFNNGINSLEGREQWQAVVRKIATRQGPYNALIQRIADEFEDFSQSNAVPLWVTLTYDWEQILKESQASDVIDPQKAGIVKKATRKVTSKIKKAEKAFGLKVPSPVSAEAQLAAAKFYLGYQQGLEDAVKSADSRNVAFKLASEMYVQDPATGETPMLTARRNLQEIRGAVGQLSNDSEELFWGLLNGNIRLLQQYLLQESACLLQSRWEKEVLLEVQGISDDQDIGQIMMGSNGFASKFIKGPAKPFIARSVKQGYYPKKVFGQGVAFDASLMRFLTKGAKAASPRKSRYSVKIRAYPTDTNRNAKIRPHATLLELQCSDKSTRMENLNYPVAKTFVWTPSSCGDVVFQISIGNLLLTKTYSGYNAFARFLEEFKSGQRTFKRSEFPSDEAALRRMGIQYIRAKYQFEGHRPALQMLYAAPGRPPRKIVSCWDQ